MTPETTNKLERFLARADAVEVGILNSFLDHCIERYDRLRAAEKRITQLEVELVNGDRAIMVPWPTEPNPPAKELTIDQLGWPPHATYSNQTDAPSCGSCGNIMQRAGSCYCCSACGTTTGCG